MLSYVVINDIINIKSVALVMQKCVLFFVALIMFLGKAAGGAVGWDTSQKAGRSRVRFSVVSLEFFIDIILPAALWPWGCLSL